MSNGLRHVSKKQVLLEYQLAQEILAMQQSGRFTEAEITIHWLRGMRQINESRK